MPAEKDKLVGGTSYVIIRIGTVTVDNSNVRMAIGKIRVYKSYVGMRIKKT